MVKMVAVDAVFTMPSYAYTYDEAHDLMEDFVKTSRGKVSSGSEVVLSFRDFSLPQVPEPFLFGLAEYFIANPHITWGVRFLDDDSRAFLSRKFPSLRSWERNDVPYVERRPLRF